MPAGASAAALHVARSGKHALPKMRTRVEGRGTRQRRARLSSHDHDRAAGAYAGGTNTAQG